MNSVAQPQELPPPRRMEAFGETREVAPAVAVAAAAPSSATMPEHGDNDNFSTNNARKKDNQEDEIPEDFLCPINYELMTDPVRTPYGHSFQLSSIIQWLTKERSCPLTRQALSPWTLQTNQDLLAKIRAWQIQNGVAKPIPLASPTDRDRELEKQKKSFRLFLRVLIKYLEQKDPRMQIEVKAIIVDCAERNKRGEPGYESATKRIWTRLKIVVPECYWMRAEHHWKRLMEKKRKVVMNPLRVVLEKRK